MKRKLLLSLLLTVSAHAASPEPVTIFGLPLGGKLKSMPKQCPTSVISDDRSTLLCWLEKPFFYKPTGSLSGGINVPNRHMLPKWAAFALVDAQISKNGELEELDVRSLSSGWEIARSIEARFGTPTVSRLDARRPSAEWSRPEIAIRLLCDGTEYCYVKFWSAAAKAAYDQEMDERRNQEAKRSVSP